MTALAGVHDARTPAQVISGFAGATVGREFVAGEQAAGDLRPKFDKLSAGWLAAGGQVYVSFKPRPADVASGAWAPWLKKLGVWLAEHPGVKVIVWHEPEDDHSGTAFASMFAKCRDAIKSGWQGATVAYCAMAYHWRPTGNAGKSPAAWQRIVADEYLVDVYSGKTFPETAILPEHPGFTGWFDAIVRPRLSGGEAIAWGIAERGFQAKDSATRATTIRREADWLATLPGAFAGGAPTKRPPMLYLYWNTGGTEDNAGWILDGAGEEALRYLLAQHLTSQATPTEVPAPTPAPAGPVVLDRYQEGFAAGVEAGRASRDTEVEVARMEGRAAGYAAAYQEILNMANAKLTGAA
jgi:hypothetical protein